MKDQGSLHLKVQELCDCFATSDPLQEMSRLPGESDKDEGALKWLALAVLHGINGNAKKISINKTADGKVTVVAKYRKSELPSPGGEVGLKIFEAVKKVTHLDKGQGEMPLAVGVRDSSLELKVVLEKDGGTESVIIEFPK
jgi:hypothetical protein